MINEKLKKTVVKMITDKMLKEAVKRASYLSWGPLNYLANKLIFKVINEAIELGILELSVAMVRHDINKNIAQIRNIVQKYELKKTEDERRALDEELKKAYDKLFEF